MLKLSAGNKSLKSTLILLCRLKITAT